MTGQWRDVTLRKVVSGLDSWNIILSTVVCGICFAEPDMFFVYEDYCGSIRRRNTPCNVEDDLHAGLIIIEAWFRDY